LISLLVLPGANYGAICGDSNYIFFSWAKLIRAGSTTNGASDSKVSSYYCITLDIQLSLRCISSKTNISGAIDFKTIGWGSCFNEEYDVAFRIARSYTFTNSAEITACSIEEPA
jgi:hypothetical protein